MHFEATTCGVFAASAGSDPSQWKRLEGATIYHPELGIGTIIRVSLLQQRPVPIIAVVARFAIDEPSTRVLSAGELKTKLASARLNIPRQKIQVAPTVPTVRDTGRTSRSSDAGSRKFEQKAPSGGGFTIAELLANDSSVAATAPSKRSKKQRQPSTSAIAGLTPAVPTPAETSRPAPAVRSQILSGASAAQPAPKSLTSSIALAKPQQPLPLDLLVFDLDNTLVASDFLESFRGRDNLRRNDDNYRTRLRAALATSEGENAILIPESALLEIGTAFPGLKLSIFTRAPSSYVDTVLKHYYPRIRWSVVIAFEDVKQQKPAPEGISVILSKTGVRPDRCVLIGDSRVDIEAAYAAGVRCAWWAARQKPWGRDHAQETLPDWSIKTPRQIEQILTAPASGRLLLETAIETLPIEASRAERIKHWNDVEPKEQHFGKLLSPSVDVECFGRYFKQHSVFSPTIGKHRLTASILAFKDGAAMPPPTVAALAHHLVTWSKYHAKRGGQLIASVIPDRPNGNQRLSRLLSAIETHWKTQGLGDHVAFNAKLLTVPAGAVSSARSHLTKVERIEKVRSSLRIGESRPISRSNIWLLDDVVTSGATLFYGKKFLTDAGASSVTCCAMAKTVSPYHGSLQ